LAAAPTQYERSFMSRPLSGVGVAGSDRVRAGEEEDEEEAGLY